ncbi:MAG: TetR/AcrR family transcriptional regulator [Erysipelotrichaceae bacterium]|nr:TetR/AcrR family transcriptional regulator [Erysipelotrichaceae bacterium]
MEFILPKTKKAREKFDRIIQAADYHIYTYGFEKASIANITASADVATGTFYLYFKDKLELYHYLLDDYQRRIKEHIKFRSIGCKTREEKERIGLIAWLEFVNENPHTYSIIWQSLAINKELFINYYKKFVSSYEKGLNRDASQVIDMDLEDLSLMLMGISSFLGLKGMINDEIVLSQEEIEKTADQIMAALNSGIFKK